MFGTTQRRSATTTGRFRSGRVIPGRFVTMPVDLGPATEQVALVLYMVGVRGRSALSAVSASVGSIKCDVLFAGATPEFPGVDQVNVRLARWGP
jgi:uncharacterized protein (TIGR03437 family)